MKRIPTDELDTISNSLDVLETVANMLTDPERKERAQAAVAQARTAVIRLGFMGVA